MKNILIIGVARSGKSRFSKKFKNYNHIPMDYFTSSLKHNFKDIGITSNIVIDRDSSKKLSLLLSRVMNIMNDTEEKFIIDSAHLYPEDIYPYIDTNKWDIYCLGYPTISVEDKFNEIRKYDTDKDWTYKRNDEELKDIISKLINISKEMKKTCEKLNIKFIDTNKEML